MDTVSIMANKHMPTTYDYKITMFKKAKKIKILTAKQETNVAYILSSSFIHGTLPLHDARYASRIRKLSC